MLNYFIMCRSLTYAQKAARVLERSGIAASVSRPPAEVSGEGCAYAVRIAEKNLPAALVALKSAVPILQEKGYVFLPLFPESAMMGLVATR